jgi:hypothetical protein
MVARRFGLASLSAEHWAAIVSQHKNELGCSMTRDAGEQRGVLIRGVLIFNLQPALQSPVAPPSSKREAGATAPTMSMTHPASDI